MCYIEKNTSMPKKKKVAILVGGPSSEHEVSLKSGERVLRGIDPDKYETKRILVDKAGNWEQEPKDLAREFDVAFIAMHGTYGEDGTVQSILEESGLSYTGSDSLSSALAMNKYLSGSIFRNSGFYFPHSFLVHRFEWGKFKTKDYWPHWVRSYIGLPTVVKPNNQGSSVGVRITHSEEEAEDALGEVFKISKDGLFQTYIKGREITCGVLDHGWPDTAYALLPTEIIPRKSKFFDFDAKYTPEASYEITPPPGMSEAMIRKIQQIALKSHRALNCRGFSRTDMILDETGNIYVLEVNTIPGLTETSLLPKAAAASGISFSKLIDEIIEAAQRRKGN